MKLGGPQSWYRCCLGGKNFCPCWELNANFPLTQHAPELLYQDIPVHNLEPFKNFKLLLNFVMDGKFQGLVSAVVMLHTQPITLTKVQIQQSYLVINQLHIMPQKLTGE
jgi:hypothetical protein